MPRHSDATPDPTEETAPRYTSYPTAPHFHGGVNEDTVAAWMDAVPAGDSLSLYLHVPYCDRLCWFCACHTRQTLRYEPVTRFLAALHAEIDTVGRRFGRRQFVRELHLGGGSPTLLRPDDMIALGRRLRSAFLFASDASVAVEIDPNDIDEARLDALAAFGLTRASLGIQDFDARVQAAINREQSFERTRHVIGGLRARGVGSVNLDLLYGLPHQTEATVAATVDKVLSLAPDRIALFGYAHVPWFKRHQTMIDQTALPGPAARLAQAGEAARRIVAAGYEAIGHDHFALPQDTLARAARAGILRRNFQGYTSDMCETLVGLGPSAVSRFREGYAQNHAATGEYERIVAAGGLAQARGYAFGGDDRARAFVIERLMCAFGFPVRETIARFGADGRAIVAEAEMLSIVEPELLVREGDRFTVPRAMRPLVRRVASRFDRYLREGKARHSVVV